MTSPNRPDPLPPHPSTHIPGESVIGIWCRLVRLSAAAAPTQTVALEHELALTRSAVRQRVSVESIQDEYLGKGEPR